MLSTIRGVVRRSNRLGLVLARAAAEGNMTANVTVTRGGTGAPTWDAATHQLTHPAAQTVYSGYARIGTVSGPVTMQLGDEPQYFQSTFISIPISAGIPEADDIVTVTGANDDKLIGRSYRVVDVERGGQLPVVHRMQVVGIEPGRTWRP